MILERILIFHPAIEKLTTTFNQLTEEQKKSEHLLLNILPETVVHRLKEELTNIAEAEGEVTVLFADISCYVFNLYNTKSQDASPGGHAALAERDDSLRQHYNIFKFSHYTI